MKEKHEIEASKDREEAEMRNKLKQVGDSAATRILFKEFNALNDHFFIPLSELTIDKQIGLGASAEVYSGLYRETDVAIKRLKILEIKEENLKEFKREVHTLTKVRHPNLVLFMGAACDKKNVCIITEYCSGGSLFALLHEQREKVELSWKQKLKIALDTAIGMNFLHCF